MIPGLKWLVSMKTYSLWLLFPGEIKTPSRFYSPVLGGVCPFDWVLSYDMRFST